MEWISVKDRLPEDDKSLEFYGDSVMRFTTVLCYNGTVKTTNRLNVHNKPNYPNIEKTDGWVWSTYGEVTHWMPLPASPEVANGN